jgi:hypothetical protein
MQALKYYIGVLATLVLTGRSDKFSIRCTNFVDTLAGVLLKAQRASLVHSRLLLPKHSSWH